MPATSPLPIKRLLLVGVLIPAVFSALDHWLLNRLHYHPSDIPTITSVMAAYVVQVGLLGWLCGTLLENPWWRWGLYIWCWVLIDLQLLSASVAAIGWRGQDMLPGSLFAAQVGLAIVWAVLGTQHWAIRLPACAVLGALLSSPISVGYNNVFDLLVVQMISLAGLCLLLRWRRFKLQQVTPTPGPAAAGTPASAADARSMQFSIRHVLIWTSSLAVVLGILRAADLLTWNTLRSFAGAEFIFLASAGLLIACVFVVAVWAAVGSGPAWLRIPVLLLSLFFFGMSVAFLSWNTERIRYYPGSDFTALWTPWGWQTFRDHWWRALWVALAGSLLFASLLIHRAIGLRLIRTVRPHISPKGGNN